MTLSVVSVAHGLESDRDTADRVDLVVIGAGLSGVAAVVEFLKIVGQANPVTIKIFDPSGVVGGVAYGTPSGVCALTITTVRDFLPERERTDFIQWLGEHFDKRLADPDYSQFFEVNRRWIDRNQAAIDANRWEDLYVPRRLFGAYLQDQLTMALRDLHPDSDVGIVPARVDEVLEGDAGYSVRSGTDWVVSSSVVVAVGAGKASALVDSSLHPGVVRDAYDPSIEETVSRIYEAASSGEKKKLLIVGGNAACMDLLYHIAHLDLFGLHTTVVTPTGALPFEYPPQHSAPGEDWKPARSRALLETDRLTASAIEEAFRTDLDMTQDGVPQAKTFFELDRILPELLARLDRRQLAAFAGKHGYEIGRWHRRAGSESIGAAKLLESRDALSIRRGNVRSIDDASEQVNVSWADGEQFCDESFDLVVNCAGSSSSARLRLGPLATLVDRGLISESPGGRGILVDDGLAAAPGLFILGPLLAGNVINDQAVWHVEHCGRLIGYARALAPILQNRVTKS